MTCGARRAIRPTSATLTAIGRGRRCVARRRVVAAHRKRQGVTLDVGRYGSGASAPPSENLSPAWSQAFAPRKEGWSIRRCSAGPGRDGRRSRERSFRRSAGTVRPRSRSANPTNLPGSFAGFEKDCAPMPFTHTTSTAAGAWRPDIYTFAPTDVVPEALILQCSTVASEIEGDEPVMRVAYVTTTKRSSPRGIGDPQRGARALKYRCTAQNAHSLLSSPNEQYNQTNTASQLAQSVSRAVTRRANLAFVAEPAPIPPAVAPVAGLVNVASVVQGDGVKPITRRASRSHRRAAGQPRNPVSHSGGPVGLGRAAKAQDRHHL